MRNNHYTEAPILLFKQQVQLFFSLILNDQLKYFNN